MERSVDRRGWLEAGRSGLEYVGITVVAALVAGFVVYFTPIPITRSFNHAVCVILQFGNCGIADAGPVVHEKSPYVVRDGAITASGEQLDLDAMVLFDYNQATLTGAAQGVLAKAADKVRASGRKGVVSVTGHTDSDGSDGANLELSKRRAQAVADALAPLLGSGFTFSVDGKGETDPVAPNDTDAGKAANRRVTILPPK